ncbi:hypothetical conserved protein [Rhizobium etli CFN 42]|uniref:Transmembrane protein n=3 Tax=Rhizobium etli TaxID=29449 RepID=A0AAN1BCK4_RHIET|nr:hypothetical conserved protein [Rhizobium etli CFN 42]ARQ08407.1 hypothetical protein NXC12_CH00311 [Rhizobium etli]
MFSCRLDRAALHKRRSGNFVELTPNLAGTFIAICHSTDYQTPRLPTDSTSAKACGNHCERHYSMGKSIALLFACAALIIMAGSFVAPGSVAAIKGDCSPAYGVDPCSTASISH